MAVRTALVTGASQGLGAAIARRLGSDGVAVAVAARRKPESEAVAESIRAAGGRAIAVTCDVTDREQVDAAVAATTDAFGSLDILVSNAGVTRDALIHRMTDEDWHTVLETHLTGAFLTSRAAQAQMVPNGFGRIVFIGSTSTGGWRGQSNYSAAKAGLQGLARTLSLELGRFGITVNVVQPGHIDSELTRGTAERLGMDYADMAADRIVSNAIKRVGLPDDVANAVSFFAGERAGYVTGQVLSVSGKPSIL
ncbi:SDR family oxidoreductase [Cryobacterium aureum]|uniref:SDR family oxidoreductase n=1 Tax=Cryobacterium aureum TaxID=995037 RepID=UPI000CF3FE83|nr:SDR family NAD(P)-dependent oxidoreductase [Cryobacterium aureum]